MTQKMERDGMSSPGETQHGAPLQKGRPEILSGTPEQQLAGNSITRYITQARKTLRPGDNTRAARERGTERTREGGDRDVCEGRNVCLGL